MTTLTRWSVLVPLLLALAAGLLPRTQAADVSVGGFGTYLDTDDYDEAWGGGLRLKYDLVEYLALDFRGSMVRLQSLSANMFPLEGNLLLQVPLGRTVLPYGGMGVGYYLFDGGDFELEHSLGYGPVAGL